MARYETGGDEVAASKSRRRVCDTITVQYNSHACSLMTVITRFYGRLSVGKNVSL